jgi:hypothetical protein
MIGSGGGWKRRAPPYLKTKILIFFKLEKIFEIDLFPQILDGSASIQGTIQIHGMRNPFSVFVLSEGEVLSTNTVHGDQAYTVFAGLN